MGTKIDMIGQTFGKLTVIEEGSRLKSGVIKWVCLCECGNRKEISGRALRSGMTTSCGCNNRAFLQGKRFGRLTVIEESGNKNNNIVWKCLCDCGNTCYETSNVLLQGQAKSCGCLRGISQIKDLTGQRFGRLTAIKYVIKEDKLHRVYWLCECECGNQKLIPSYSLTTGKSTSCGCKNIERFKTHGMARTRLYKIWQDAKTRCNNPNTPYYFKYGGRGIKFTEQWNSFEPFMEWALANGYQDNLTLDRIDVNGDYEPSNCRWITNSEQQLNKRNNHNLTYNGKTQTIREWADEMGMQHRTLSSRIMDYHWSVEKALTTPVKKHKKKETKNGIKNN